MESNHYPLVFQTSAQTTQAPKAYTAFGESGNSLSRLFIHEDGVDMAYFSCVCQQIDNSISLCVLSNHSLFVDRIGCSSHSIYHCGSTSPECFRKQAPCILCPFLTRRLSTILFEEASWHLLCMYSVLKRPKTLIITD